MSNVLIPDNLKPLLRPIDSLTEYPNNAQQHSKADVQAFCKVLEKFGWTVPIVAWRKDGTTYISAGHLRYRAAKALGLDSVPVVERSDWNETEFRAYTIADNQWTKRAEWNLPVLREELVTIDDGSFDLDLTGFNELQLRGMIDEEEPGEELWKGMPEFHQDEMLGTAFCCIVRCRTEEDFRAFEKLLGYPLQHSCGRKYTAWFPPQARELCNRKGYTSES